MYSEPCASFFFFFPPQCFAFFFPNRCPTVVVMVLIQRIAYTGVLHEGRTVVCNVSQKAGSLGWGANHSEGLIMAWFVLMFSPELGSTWSRSFRTGTESVQ